VEEDAVVTTGIRLQPIRKLSLAAVRQHCGRSISVLLPKKNLSTLSRAVRARRVRGTAPSPGEITRRSALFKASNGAQEFGLPKILRVTPHEPVVDRELLGDSIHGTTP
jgi:hypothetical protein